MRGWVPPFSVNGLSSLPAECDVCAVQLPGQTVRLSEPPIASIPEGLLVDGIVAGIMPYLDLPFVFFGHSMGAILAAETTREWCRGVFAFRAI